MEIETNNPLTSNDGWFAEPMTFTQLSEAFRCGTEIELSNGSETKTATWSPTGEDPFLLLTKGGVVPFRYLKSGKATIFLDSNVVSRCLEQVKEQFDRSDIRISAALTAVEGSKRRNQTLDEYRENLESVYEDLNCLDLQNASFFPSEDIEQLHSIIVNDFIDPNLEEKFLRCAGKFLNSNAKKQSDEDLLNKLLRCADDAGVGRGELAFLAALQIIFAPTEKMLPGKTYFDAGNRVIKLKSDPTDGDLYNAINDLRLIKILAAGPTIGINSCLLTDDKGIALFWSGLSIMCNENTSGSVDMVTSFSITNEKPEMYPSMSREHYQLVASPSNKGLSQ